MPLTPEQVKEFARELGRKVCLGECDGVDERAAKRIIQRIAQAAAQAEREANIATIRKYLLFNDQRAVSWLEVQDTIAAIRVSREQGAR